jgi:hypothetical protein
MTRLCAHIPWRDCRYWTLALITSFRPSLFFPLSFHGSPLADDSARAGLGRVTHEATAQPHTVFVGFLHFRHGEEMSIR